MQVFLRGSLEEPCERAGLSDKESSYSLLTLALSGGNGITMLFPQLGQEEVFFWDTKHPLVEPGGSLIPFAFTLTKRKF